MRGARPPEEGDTTARSAEATAAIREVTTIVPRVALVLGSGLGGVADDLSLEASGAARGAAIATATLPNWPRSTVSGHAGRLTLGYWNGVPVAALSGRAHAYEGYGLDRVTLPIRVFAALGARVLLLTNAVGSLHPRLAPGSLMLVRDHLNFQGTRGLVALGEIKIAGDRSAGRPTPVYSPRWIERLREAARSQGLALAEGVLLGGLGPSYESGSEIAAARRWGADAACMSTVTEAVVGARLGMEVAAISCVTNFATGLAREPLTHEEVIEVADGAARSLRALLAAAVASA